MASPRRGDGQPTLGGVLGWFDALDRQVRPEAIGHGEQLIARADRFGPRRSLASLMAQLHYPPQRSLKGLADRYAGLLQLRSEFGAGARAFGDGGEIPDHMGPADLASLQGEVVVD